MSEVIVVMGSKSDLPTMAEAVGILEDLGVGVSVEILSAHRTPELLAERTKIWEKSGVRVVVAGAGGAAHLPGMLASFCVLPVIGVPVKSKSMHGLDALLSIAQMPKGIPVATVAVGNAFNAGLLAARILAQGQTKASEKIQKKLLAYTKSLNRQVKSDRQKLKARGWKVVLREL